MQFLKKFYFVLEVRRSELIWKHKTMMHLLESIGCSEIITSETVTKILTNLCKGFHSGWGSSMIFKMTILLPFIGFRSQDI